jgi:branched-subunit amino acid transport protein AzlD
LKTEIIVLTVTSLAKNAPRLISLAVPNALSKGQYIFWKGNVLPIALMDILTIIKLLNAKVI